MGLVLAYGYAKTYSLYIPIGIHFGGTLHKYSFFVGLLAKACSFP